ncbi:hypothetical protein [Dasania marina]|uniref:hypothetical protein n=1 Tax=Dasania marina TaxID=471499 RepID=UPI0030DA4C13|tara:strand:+ start:31792 stop:32214 length:423 start_codon:yes stop_codon:yes gene_type:complete
MSESPDAENSNDKAENTEQLAALQVWASWLQQSAAMGSELLQLLQLELRLAIKDSKRLFVLALLFVPLLILAWLGFTVLLAWLVYLVNASMTQGLLTFLALQIAGLGIIAMAWQHYKKSLRLPLTTQQLRDFVGAKSCDT